MSRKRCPNGYRRDRKTGECTPRNKSDFKSTSKSVKRSMIGLAESQFQREMKESLDPEDIALLEKHILSDKELQQLYEREKEREIEHGTYSKTVRYLA